MDKMRRESCTIGIVIQSGTLKKKDSTSYTEITNGSISAQASEQKTINSVCIKKEKIYKRAAPIFTYDAKQEEKQNKPEVGKKDRPLGTYKRVEVRTPMEIDTNTYPNDKQTNKQRETLQQKDNFPEISLGQ